MNEDIYDPVEDPRCPLALTVLRADDGRRLAKRFFLGLDDNVAIRAFDDAKWYMADCIVIDGIAQLHGAIEVLEGLADCCVVRGSMTRPSDTRVRRLKSQFPEVARRWLMLDVDRADLLPGGRVADDPRGSACSLVERLVRCAPDLQGVSAVVRWSTSAGTAELAETDIRWARVAKPGVSAHLWYVLSEAHGEGALKRWIAAVNGRAGTRLLDPATVRTVQPIYTASPIFSDGLADPLAGRRTHLVLGDRDEAALQIPPCPLPAPQGGAARIAPRPALPQNGASNTVRDESGVVRDGRDSHLSRIAYRLVRQAAEQGRDPAAHMVAIADAAWAEFSSTADLSRPRSSGLVWCRDDAATKVGQKIAALRTGALPGSSMRSIQRSLSALWTLRGGR